MKLATLIDAPSSVRASEALERIYISLDEKTERLRPLFAYNHVIFNFLRKAMVETAGAEDRELLKTMPDRFSALAEKLTTIDQTYNAAVTIMEHAQKGEKSADKLRLLQLLPKALDGEMKTALSEIEQEFADHASELKTFRDTHGAGLTEGSRDFLTGAWEMAQAGSAYTRRLGETGLFAGKGPAV